MSHLEIKYIFVDTKITLVKTTKFVYNLIYD